jgi:3-hydroxybutyrate dehydrogenase
MKRQNFGRIINIASVHGHVASARKAPYVASKHGVIGFTKAVALEVAPKYDITINAVCPGWVLTPLVEKQIPDTMAARGMTKAQVINDVLLAAQPTKQFVTSDQVAAMAVFLCSDAASQITGANLSMDGGWTAA